MQQIKVNQASQRKQEKEKEEEAAGEWHGMKSRGDVKLGM
jgi:hypothetical protein